MDVPVEYFKRHKIVGDKNSPQLYCLRQKPRTCGAVGVDILAVSIQKNYAMTKGDVKRVIEVLVKEIQTNPANDDKVEPGLLGTFHMTFHCPGVERSEDCTTRNISKVNIRFAPDRELKLMSGSTATIRSPVNVAFALDEPVDGSSPGGSGSENPGDGEENDPLG